MLRQARRCFGLGAVRTGQGAEPEQSRKLVMFVWAGYLGNLPIAWPALGRRSNLEPHANSIAPLLSADRQAVEHLAMELPLWHESIHQRDETGVVGGLQ